MTYLINSSAKDSWRHCASCSSLPFLAFRETGLRKRRRVKQIQETSGQKLSCETNHLDSVRLKRIALELILGVLSNSGPVFRRSVSQLGVTPRRSEVFQTFCGHAQEASWRGLANMEEGAIGLAANRCAKDSLIKNSVSPIPKIFGLSLQIFAASPVSHVDHGLPRHIPGFRRTSLWLLVRQGVAHYQLQGTFEGRNWRRRLSKSFAVSPSEQAPSSRSSLSKFFCAFSRAATLTSCTRAGQEPPWSLTA